jgi:DNA-binding response OmpR family regulator
MPFKILVVDDKIDDPSEEISALPGLLRSAGYEVGTTADENEAYDLFWEYHPDLVVLDIMFDNRPTGVEICDAIRRNTDDTPIILVTRFRKETKEILDGFKAGADDYVILPCDNQEIMARIRANLPPEAVIVDDYMQIDFAGHRVWARRNRDWQQVHLSRRLWQLLEVLIINAGIIVPTTSIKDRVYGKPVGDSALAVAVHKLRQAIEPDPGHPVYIEAMRGIGYRFNGTLVRANSVSPTGRMRLSSGAKQANLYVRSGERTAAAQDDSVLRARLMEHAGVAVDRLLAGKREGGLRPSDIERLARAAGQYMVKRFFSELSLGNGDRESRVHA